MRMMESAGRGMQNGFRKVRAVCVLLAAVMALSLAGCGEGYDPTALVKANLDYMTGGEVTDGVQAATGQSAEELKRLYENEINSSVNEIMQGLQISLDEEAAEEMRLLVGTFVDGAMKKVKYEVKEEFTEKDGVYHVEVDVYPLDLMTAVQEWLEGKEYLDEWKKKLKSGKYVYTTDEQLVEDICRYMYDKANSFVEEAGYLDPVTMTVRVEEKDGTYMPNREDIAAVGAAAMGE